MHLIKPIPNQLGYCHKILLHPLNFKSSWLLTSVKSPSLCTVSWSQGSWSWAQRTAQFWAPGRFGQPRRAQRWQGNQLSPTEVLEGNFKLTTTQFISKFAGYLNFNGAFWSYQCFLVYVLKYWSILLVSLIVYYVEKSRFKIFVHFNKITAM